MDLLGMDLDSDSDDERTDAEGENEPNLTGFLFGNIDSEGRLDNDLFDGESLKQLNSLSKYVQGYNE